MYCKVQETTVDTEEEQVVLIKHYFWLLKNAITGSLGTTLLQKAPAATEQRFLSASSLLSWQQTNAECLEEQIDWLCYIDGSYVNNTLDDEIHTRVSY